MVDIITTFISYFFFFFFYTYKKTKFLEFCIYNLPAQAAAVSIYLREIDMIIYLKLLAVGNSLLRLSTAARGDGNFSAS